MVPLLFSPLKKKLHGIKLYWSLFMSWDRMLLNLNI